MKRNGLKIYSIIISIIAALLIAAAAVMLTMLIRKEQDSQSTKINSEINSETSTETTTEETSSSEKQNIENRYNAGNIVLQANGEEEEGYSGEYILAAWANMIEKLDLDADVVFFGDSITERSDFKWYFPDKKIVNLGLGGDKISGAMKRYYMLSYLKPEKVFVMCGVNELRDDNVDKCITEYAKLLDGIKETVPEAQIYVESILPIASYMQDFLPCHEATSEYFNAEICTLAAERGMTYIDLYSDFVLNGEMNEEFSVDEVHINDAGYELWAQKINNYIYN